MQKDGLVCLILMTALRRKVFRYTLESCRQFRICNCNNIYYLSSVCSICPNPAPCSLPVKFPADWSYFDVVKHSWKHEFQSGLGIVPGVDISMPSMMMLGKVSAAGDPGAACEGKLCTLLTTFTALMEISCNSCNS